MRDYKKEYREYHSSNKQKKLRALRNKANRTMSPGPGKEVDHKVPLSKGGSNGKDNWRVVSRKTNREKYDKTANVRPRVALWLHDGKGNLLVQDDRPKGYSFKFPGGGIDPGQSVNDAATREALEEVGYTLASEPRAIPGIRAKTIKWRPKFLEYAAKKGRGDYTASKHYHRLALAGDRDEALLGSEGDALNASWIPIKDILEETRLKSQDPENDLNYFDEERLRVAMAVEKLLREKTASEFDWVTAGQHAIVPGAILGGALAATGYGHYTDNDKLKNIIDKRKGATIGSILGGFYGSTYGDDPSIVNALAGSGIGFGVGSAIDTLLKRKDKLNYFSENKAALLSSKAGATALGSIAGLPGAAIGGELGTQLGAKLDERINKKEASIGPLAQFMKISEKGVAKKTNPAKWEAAKRQAKAKMGGKHSARAMQLATQIYKKNGGGYSGKKPSSSNNKLKKWTKQKWQWSGERKKEAKELSPLFYLDFSSREKKAFFEGSHYFTDDPVKNTIRMAAPIGSAVLGGIANSYAGHKAGIENEAVLGSLFGSGVASGFGLGELLTGTPGINYRHVLYPYLGATGLGSLSGLLPDSKATARAGVYMTGAGGMAGRMLADRNTQMLKESKSKGVYLPARSISALKSTEKGKAKLRAAAKKKTEATNKGQQFSNHGLHKGKDR